MTILSKAHHDYTTINNNSNEDGGANLFTEDEIEVSNILLDMPFLMTKSLSLYRFPYTWNTKKLRSALVSPPPSQPLKLLKQASSPTTPLSFSPSDSDLKSKTRKPLPRKEELQAVLSERMSTQEQLKDRKEELQAVLSERMSTQEQLKDRKEELQAVLSERMSTQEQLKDSIEKVKLYRDKLIVENSELKAKKQKLLLVKEREKTMTVCTPQMQPLLQLQTTQVNDLVHAGAQSTTENLHQVPLIFHQISGVNDSVCAGPSTSTQFQQHYGPFMVNDPVRAGPSQFHYAPPLIHGFRINQADQHDQVAHRPRENFQFDLNMVPEDEHSMIMNAKVMAAEARQKRIQVNKEKRTRGKH